MSRTIMAILAVGAALAGWTPAAASATELTVRVTGLSDAGGELRLALFDDPGVFPSVSRAPRQEVRGLSTAVAGEMVFNFDLPPGTYAAVAFHDENGDGRLNRFLGVMPTEGYAISRNPRLTAPPQWDRVNFEVGTSGPTDLILHMNY